MIRSGKISLSNYPNPPAKILNSAFELEGQNFTAITVGPSFQFAEAISFVVLLATCEQDIDSYWSKLTAGGVESQCGWLLLDQLVSFKKGESHGLPFHGSPLFLRRNSLLRVTLNQL